MRWSVCVLVAGLSAGMSCLLHSVAEIAGAAADKADSRWIDLFPGKDLKGWKRVPILPDPKLDARNPWKVNATSNILECDGVGLREMLLHETERTNGIFHVAWRFKKVGDKDDYNSGIYVRTSLDAKIWHQAQVAVQDKAPRYADLFGQTLVDGQPKQFLVEGIGAKLAKPPGEWNTYEITFKGQKVTVAVNGKQATTWNDCQVQKGQVGLQAEFYYIEFKDLKFKSLE